MMRWRSRSKRIVFALVLMSALSLEASAEEYNPFQISRAEFFGSVDTIALWPVRVPAGVPDREGAERELESMLTSALEEKGFTVVPSARLGRRWEELSTLVGGLFDPVSGESDSDTIVLLRTLLAQEFALDYGVDAFMSTSVTEGRINVWAKSFSRFESEEHGAHTAWMGAHEELIWDGLPIDSLWQNRPQAVIGLRIGFKLYDPIHVPLYDIMVPVRWSRIYAVGSVEQRPESSLLSHRDRLDTVIDVLVEPLAGAEAESETP